MLDTEYLIVGAGIIGLSIARDLAKKGKEVTVLERNNSVGEETSFRNSAVLHAGIYYPPNSLKAKLCKLGQELLYEYCRHHSIAHKKIGKLIIASEPQQQEHIDYLYRNATQNGVASLHELTAAEIKTLEPNVRAVSGLLSPDTGIVDGQALLKSLKNDCVSFGMNFYTNTTFLNATKSQPKFHVDAKQNDKNLQFRASKLINAAGLYASQVAHSIDGTKFESIPKAYFAKGSYFKLRDEKPFSKLIYPIPESAGLGIHATIDIHNTVRFGPDVEWIQQPDYEFPIDRKTKFVEEIQKYYPALKPENLEPDFTGIRPKIFPPDQQPQDFLIHSFQHHGNRNLINLYGIESPGLTCCFSIADYVVSLFQ